MVQLVELIPDAEVVIALEPDELGLRMLPVLASARPPLTQPDHYFARASAASRPDGPTRRNHRGGGSGSAD